MLFSPRLGQEVGLHFLTQLLQAIFVARPKRNFGSFAETAEEGLRRKIHLWQHQAVLYELAGLPRFARRCRDVANKYRAKLVAVVYKSEAA